MSTIAPPSKPLTAAQVDSEHYIDAHIRRTRRALKLADLAAGVITLAIGLLGFVLLAAVLDHWVVPGGLSTAGRMIVFGVMLLALAWYAWRQFIPLLRPISSVYAAHTIERGAPTLKNSLLNLLLFRSHRQHMSARVYHALEQQAAQRLSSTPLDGAVDRAALLRLGYALLLIVAVSAAYAVLSPKNMGLSVARVLAPWTDLPAPSRVHIMDIRPGNISVARGEQVEIAATIGGLRADDRIRVHYSTVDEQLVDESISMKAPDAGIGRFVAELPRGGDAANEIGVQQDLIYWIEAGDAHSRKYQVNVFDRPTIVVQKVRYEYPAYTGFPSTESGNTGDVRGLEGTRVTISALANQPIKSAYVDFDADGRNDLKMTAEGDHATASFVLALREDRRTPQHIRYVLKFTTAEGRTNIDPPKYRIDVTPDYAPEIRITAPEEPELTVRVDETVPISIEARDPDFALSSVRLVGKVKDREATLAELLTKKHEGRFGAIKPFTPGDVRLKPGDVLEYWAEARDIRRPDANVAASEHRRLRIAGPADQPKNGQQQQRPGEQQQPQGGEPQNGENGQGGDQGQGGPQQQGDKQNGESEGSDGDGQQGPGGAGAQGESNEKSEGEQGAGGQGGAGESQDSPSQEQSQNDGAGGSSANNSQQSQDPNQQQSNGANNGAGNSGEPQQGQQNQQPGANQGQSSSEGGEQGEPSGEPAAADGQNGQPGGQNGEQGAQPEKVSSQGDDDAAAFERMREHFGEQNGGQPSDASQQAQDPQAQEQNAQGQNAPDARAQSKQQTGQDQNAQGGENQSKPQTGQGQDAQAHKTQGQPSQGQQGQGQRQAQQEGATPEGDAQENAGRDGNPNQAQTPPDKSTGAAGQGKNPSQQKPAAEGAQPQGPRETATDAQQQTNAAGQNPSPREGADAPREARNGDGNPNDPKEAQQPSPDSTMNRNNGDAGSGGSTGEEQGSPNFEQQSHKRAANKTDEDNAKRNDDKEPPMASPDKRESNSRGGQGGEQSGGGQEGGGQKADAAGKGTPGQHEAADEGGGRADEQGQGETGSKAGQDQLAQGKTGESSGDQPGEGSEQGKAGESPESQAADGKQKSDGESDAAGGEPGKQQSSQQNAGKQGAQPPGGNPSQGKSAGEQPGGQQGGENQAGQQPQPNDNPGEQQPPADGEQQPSQQPGGGQAGATQPQGGGTGGANTASDQPVTEQAQEDQANLDFAKKQTDLVLERLDQQLAKKQIDSELLKNLGWSDTELQQFVNRWKDLKNRAASEGEEAAEAKQELDESLRSLGLRPQGPTRVRASSKADKLRVNDSYRSRAPLEYADRVRIYSKNVAAENNK